MGYLFHSLLFKATENLRVKRKSMKNVNTFSSKENN